MLLEIHRHVYVHGGCESCRINTFSPYLIRKFSYSLSYGVGAIYYWSNGKDFRHYQLLLKLNLKTLHLNKQTQSPIGPKNFTRSSGIF